ncbi:hypothetical protein [Rhodococcus sp. (in: high G+C Gram-positive bacteria)]|uniref:hypothetical protein n=1 Tax=Rhodococcus sp. TaxID=1831 RepID=UPI001A319A13|nr:hypothetical protein [Rhodococcus sp. (in: high G+C Gram-positive bacteria)]MBJ7479251.1 hypothetical protein [Rhodococcus sp. (in: high G+C Gram-positive bacteria)]
MSEESIDHLDFAPTCALYDVRTNTPCERPATHIADVHMHEHNTMPRIALCDKHLAGYKAMEAQILPDRDNRCGTCHQHMHADDFIRNEETL